MRRSASFVIALLAANMLLAAPANASPTEPIPVFAYYYIWYDAKSWDRGKTTYPLLGRYSSDDVTVMRRHISEARAAGLGGFIVSWKSTPKLNRRLAALIRAADVARFKLAIIYEGLNFQRNPLPVTRVAADIGYFAHRFARDPAFDLEQKPVVIWSGTWRYSRAEVAYVARRARGRVLLLASERSIAGYERLAGFVDGDAYYWSSVDPITQHGYGSKLEQMSAAVHRRGGLWIPPVAPGFDARRVGATRVVDRRGGDTLRQEWGVALASSPDLIGLISWNEFSENSEVEPTQAFGTTYLKLLADLVGAQVTVQGDFDSSQAPARAVGYALPLLVGVAAILVTAAGASLWRREVRRAGARRT